MSSVRMFGNPNVPLILQTEVAECGLACLAMVASHLGFKIDLSTLRARFNVSLNGTSLGLLSDWAERLKLSSRGVHLTLDELDQLQTPAILHWGLNHFVVLCKVSSKNIVIHDPAHGVRHLSTAEVSKHFTGNALELGRTTDFLPADKRRKISLKSMIGRVDGWWQSLLLIFGIAVGLESLGLAAPKLNQYMVDEVLLTNDRPLRDLLALAVLLIIIVQGLLSQARGWTIMFITTQLNLQWIGDVFGRLVRLPVEWFEKRHLGDVLSRFGSIGPIQDMLTTRAVGVAIDGVMAFATLTVMYMYSVPLASIVVATVALYLIVRLVSYRPLREANLEAMALAAKEQTCLMETVRAISAIKLFGRESQRRSKWMAMKVDTINRNLRTQQMGLWFANINTLISAISAALVLWLGAGMVMDQAMTVGMLFALTSYSAIFSSRMSALVNVAIDFRMMSLHCERLADIVLEAGDADQESTLDVPHLLARIELINVSFRFAESEPWVLRNLSLVIEPGSSLAITGVSGCGKTTLAKLVLGSLQPTAGEIRYGGIPLSQIGIRAYRQQLAAVMQDDVLLAGSLKDNISFNDERPDQKLVQCCAEIAGVHDDILKMRMGYETLISDMGSSLSGGQKQRVLLARALYKRPRVLVMDEATSALDVSLERTVSAAIASLAITRIIIAHRPETISSADRVVILQAGTVAAQIDRAPVVPDGVIQ